MKIKTLFKATALLLTAITVSGFVSKHPSTKDEIKHSNQSNSEETEKEIIKKKLSNSINEIEVIPIISKSKTEDKKEESKYLGYYNPEKARKERNIYYKIMFD